MELPLLFLDVDGPLIPYGISGPESRPRESGDDGDAHPALGRLTPAHGPRLVALPCELVWATAWQDDANVMLCPHLGLPELPVVHWPDETDEDLRLQRRGVHWKTCPLSTWAAGRPFVWVDDEISDADREWVRSEHPAPALLHLVDHRRGLTAEDFAVVARWLERHGGR